MAVSINAFYRLYDRPDAVFRVGGVIKETGLQRLIQNHANAWALLNRRALLHYAPAGPAELSGTLTTLLDVGVYLSSGRGARPLEIDLYGTDFYVEIELFNDSAVSLGSVSWTQIGTAHKALTLTPSSPAARGYLQVRARYDSYGPGEIERIRVLEGAITDPAQLAAPWKPIDSSVVAANAYLHTVVARRSVENLVTLGTYRQRHPSACWRADDAPKVHGLTSELAQLAQFGGDVRTAIPFLVPRPRFGQRINVRVRGRAIGHNVTVGAVQLPLRPGERLTPSEDTVTFTPSSTLSTLTLQLDTTSWRNDVHLVLLTFASDFDATGEELEKVGVTPNLEVEPPFVLVEDGSEWSSSGALVDEIGAYWIEFVEGAQSSTTPSTPNPGKRLMLRAVEDADGSGDGSRLYIYPPIPPGQAVLALSESSKSSSGVWVRRHAIGTLALASVEWEADTSTIDLDGSWADAMEPGARTLALVARRLQTLGDTIWGRCTRVHHCGPASNPAVSDPAASLPGAADKLTSSLDYSTSWETLADCVVGDEDPFEIYTGDDFERSVYVVDALVAVVVENELDVAGAYVRGQDRLFDYNFRLQLGTVAGGSFTDGAVDAGGRIDGVPISAHVHTVYGFDDPLGYWMGFWPGGYRFPGSPTEHPPDSNFSAQPELAAHSGRGVIPARLWPSLRFQFVRLILKDTAGVSNPRLLRLQAQALGPHGGGSIGLLAPRLHLLTWTVRTLEGTDAESITPT